MQKKDFFIGQRVKQKDPDEGYTIYGKVKEIKDNSVVICWDDPDFGDLECEHREDEFHTIKIGTPNT